MFTPTKEQLEELWFTTNIYGTYQLTIWEAPFDVILTSYDWTLFIELTEHRRKIYPQSIEDIQTLIKLLTPPNNN